MFSVQSQDGGARRRSKASKAQIAALAKARKVLAAKRRKCDRLIRQSQKGGAAMGRMAKMKARASAAAAKARAGVAAAKARASPIAAAAARKAKAGAVAGMAAAKEELLPLMLAQAQSLKLLPKEQEQLEHLLPDKELPLPVEQVPKVLSSLAKEVPILLLLPDKAL